MDIPLKTIFLLSLIIFLNPDLGSGQVTRNFSLKKADCPDSISCSIHFTMADNPYREIKDSRGTKFKIPIAWMNYNGCKIPVGTFRIRGKTSLYYPKKSFTLKMDKKIDLKNARGNVSVKDCYLLGLAMDQNYIHNYLSFTLMEVLDLFKLTFSYCEVVINDKTQGIYLITERPRDYALKTIGSPAIIRRGFNEKIEKIAIDNDSPRKSKRFICKKFQKIYTHCRKYSGRALYDSINSQMDMGQYMRWLAFNFLTRNGDYTDEIYMYIDPADNRFRIIPWDYDDVFSEQPHEGNISRRKVPGGKFIFSSEDRLDRVIITDKYLYAKYLQQLSEVIDNLNDTTLHVLFHETYCAVYPYYLDDAILQTTRHDKYGSTNLANLNATLVNKLKQFKIIRNSVQSELIEKLDQTPPP